MKKEKKFNVLDRSMFVGRTTLKKIFGFFTEGKKDLSVFYPVRLPDGSLHWFDDNGQKHRKNGPAIISANGSKEYYHHGKRSRLDGAAIEDAKGNPVAWYINGEAMSRGEFLRKRTTVCLKNRVKNSFGVKI